MDNEYITIEDCIEMYEKKNMCVLLSNGKVVKFEKEI